MDFAVTQLFTEMFQDVEIADEKGFVIRPYNLGKTVSMRDLDPAGMSFESCSSV